MDYVVGSVAALVSGNVTPNRPKLVRRALTPMKHQPSPNVTPKSELVDDRSIFLSPTLQKKKAIIKKSPKRIFENPDLDVTSENENDSNPTSPKANKVKKHLNQQLGAQSTEEKSQQTPKSPKKKQNKSGEVSSLSIPSDSVSPQSANESTPKKQKKRKSSAEENHGLEDENITNSGKSKKNKKKNYLLKNISNDQEESIEGNQTPKKHKKNAKNQSTTEDQQVVSESNQQPQTDEQESKSSKKKSKKNRKKLKDNTQPKAMTTDDNVDQVEEPADLSPVKTKKSKKSKKDMNYINPNAVTDKDSDSEHESDDEIVSENEEANKEMLGTAPVDESSDEEEEAQTPKKAENKENTENNAEPRSRDEVKRTLFVGNVPFSKKCKKEIKKIFSKYGDIETVRIRTVPVKDARVTPKMAVVKNELHPERTTVNVYVKFKEASSVDQALSENNTVLNNCHLRVSRSESTGAEHDPRCSVFVGNVPFALEDETLREKFEKCGEIVSVRIIRDKKTSAGKGFAYVNFASKDGVELALAMSEEDLTIKNRILRVKRCSQGSQKQKNQPAGKVKGFQRQNQGRNYQGKNQFGQKGGNFKQRQGQTEEGTGEGAMRRIMHKRKNQDGSDGPPDKRQRNINQPHKDKKVRKEFVGMTAEKKKKNTFNKGQKKKKALSEILTKYS